MTEIKIFGSHNIYDKLYIKVNHLKDNNNMYLAVTPNDLITI
jgi:hypothetical protein